MYSSPPFAVKTNIFPVTKASDVDSQSIAVQL